MIWLRRIFLALIALAIAQIVYYYPQMPAVVASHFDGLGAANDWSSKKGLFGLYAAILVMLVGVFIFVPGWSWISVTVRKKLGFRSCCQLSPLPLYIFQFKKAILSIL